MGLKEGLISQCTNLFLENQVVLKLNPSEIIYFLILKRNSYEIFNKCEKVAYY